MTDTEKSEIAVGRWSLFKECHYVPTERELLVMKVATKTVFKMFNRNVEKDQAYCLTGEEMLLRVNLAIALIETGALK